MVGGGVGLWFATLSPAPARPACLRTRRGLLRRALGEGMNCFVNGCCAREQQLFPLGVVDSFSPRTLFLKNHYRSWKEEAAWLGGCERPGAVPQPGQAPTHLTPGPDGRPPRAEESNRGRALRPWDPGRSRPTRWGPLFLFRELWSRGEKVTRPKSLPPCPRVGGHSPAGSPLPRILFGPQDPTHWGTAPTVPFNPRGGCMSSFSFGRLYRQGHRALLCCYFRPPRCHCRYV